MTHYVEDRGFFGVHSALIYINIFYLLFPFLPRQWKEALMGSKR